MTGYGQQRVMLHFSVLKISAPVLVFINFQYPFVIDTDASQEGLGTVHSREGFSYCLCKSHT